MRKEILLIFLILIAGCSSLISQKEAEKNAVSFVNANVKFFAKEQNSTVDLPQYKIDSMDSYLQDSNWFVAMHVSSQINGTAKKNDMTFLIDGKGNVIEFNGKKLSKN